MFCVIRSRVKARGYSIRAPRGITWAVGPGHSFGWFRLKRDAQWAADVHNKALAMGLYELKED